MNTRAASTSTPAPPAITSATPEKRTPARPPAITTRVAAAAASTAMTVAAADPAARRVQLARGSRHGAEPSRAAASTGIRLAATPRWPPETRAPTPSASPTVTASRAR